MRSIWSLPIALALAAAETTAAPLKLHVPSPDWRDQIIYFALTDRFADGDPSNNDQGAGEYQAGASGGFNGGDLKGLTRHLDYIRGLGATALWITPPVANQWKAPQTEDTGYHGYWAENFLQLDRHLGTIADYRRLSDALHRRGMFLVQDIVLNHTGNFFQYQGGWDRGDPTRFYAATEPSKPHPRPTQPPFDLNDPRDPLARRAGIYHWTPDIANFSDPDQELNFQLAGLDDLNTESPLVRRALRQSYGYWIREVGVDAFRVDTAFYVPPALFDDFLRSRDKQAPGIETVARQSGRRQFLSFGEGFGIEKPFDDTQAKKIERYMTGADGRPLMPGMLNFPLYGALNDAFARGRPTAELAHRIRAMSTLHARPHLMPSFVDNHDVDRFLAGGSVAALKQALLAMMTLPGIPVIYYGTEQGFTESRASMFAAGWGSGGRDRFDRSAPLYGSIASMSALRRSSKAFTRATPVLLGENGAGPGAVAWRMSFGGESYIVALNSSDESSLLDNLETGAAGARMKGVFAIDGAAPDLAADAQGRISLRLPPRAGWVWRVNAGDVAKTAPTITMQALPGTTDVVGGSARGAAEIQLVVDGRVSQALRVRPDAEGRWQARLDAAGIDGPVALRRLVAWDEASGRASKPLALRVGSEWQLLADVADPAGDDRGPGGRYTYPSDESYADDHAMDLRRVRVFGAGGALKLELTMNRVSTSWNPANGFDHVAFTVFIERPGQAGGATVMPLQDATLPAGMRWHRRLRVHGWQNALFAATGASADNEGTPVTPSADIEVDKARHTVSLVLSSAALGGPLPPSGTRIYVTTWDYDAGYRALVPVALSNAMGGGEPGQPKVMDDSPVIELP